MKNKRKLVTLLTSAALASLMLSGCTLFPSQHHGSHVRSSEPTERDTGDESEDAGTKRVVKHPAKESLPSRGNVKKVEDDSSKTSYKKTDRDNGHPSKSTNDKDSAKQDTHTSQASRLQKQEASDSEDSLQMGRWHVQAYESSKAGATQQIKQFDDWAQSHKLPVPSDEGSIKIIGNRAIIKWDGHTEIGSAEATLDRISH